MGYVSKYLKYLVISYLIALVLLCLTGVIFAYTNINDSLINTFVFVIVVITNLIGSTLISRSIKKRGLIVGLIFGFIYFLVIYLLSVLLYTGFFLNSAVGMYLGLALISGVIGGVIGVNLGR